MNDSKKRRLRHALVRANIAIRTERPLYPEYSNPVDDSLVDAVGEQGVATLKSWRLMRKLRCSTTCVSTWSKPSCPSTRHPQPVAGGAPRVSPTGSDGSPSCGQARSVSASTSARIARA